MQILPNIQFSPINGAVTFFAAADESNSRVSPSVQLFSLALLDSSGNQIVLSSNQFLFQREENSLQYYAQDAFAGLWVNMRFHIDGRTVAFRPEITGIPDGLRLEWFDGPQITVSDSGELFWPLCEGCIVEQPKRREESAYGRYRPLSFSIPDKFYGGFYPGFCNLQFLTHHQNSRGIYFGAHDPSFGPKAVEFAPASPNTTRLSLQTFCGAAEKSYTSPFEYILALSEENWMDGAEQYRNWLPETPPPKFADWMTDSPVTLIYPVRGHGRDNDGMEANEYFPYSNALPTVRRFRQDFDSRVMPLIMHWEGTAPWAPPYVWPPYGGEAALAEFRDALHAEGDLLGVYCSGTAWTCESTLLPEYNTHAHFENEHLESIMMRGPKTQLDASICCGKTAQRFGYDLCLATERAQKIVLDEILKLADFDLDYAQYFDQNMGGAFYLAYCDGHGHPAGPGAWQTRIQKQLLGKVVREIQARGKKLVLGCEGAAADPYVRELPFNDARSNCGWIYGRPVPAHAFVHHGSMLNFMGNQVNFSNKADIYASPDNLLYRTAYAFAAGDMLSVVLKSNGEIHWNWCLDWNKPAPDQESVITLIKNLNACRKQYPEFLLYGKMLRPIHQISGGIWEMKFLDPARPTQKLDSFFATSWESPDNRTCTFVVNYLPSKQSLQVDGKWLDLEPLSVIAIS